MDSDSLALSAHTASDMRTEAPTFSRIRSARLGSARLNGNVLHCNPDHISIQTGGQDSVTFGGRDHASQATGPAASDKLVGTPAMIAAHVASGALSVVIIAPVFPRLGLALATLNATHALMHLHVARSGEVNPRLPGNSHL